ncbi:protealysin inhibitor emfourin [Phycicoccus sp. M110.8]|uniref:protealysin inhibitor emfourin n=1 Tax=Phycicoccus sp. M110.8 TaxID=3075433 RepID=UPI0028FDAB82|nr:protealysin inhibitor emfourin [Phycicoccus sp. M110.8]MDU0313707.1 protealysin inhibitor emfourin [Phycicoccus sp. M110.8]
MPEMSESPRCTIVPPYLLEALSSQGSGEVAHCASRTLSHDGEWRSRRGAGGARHGATGGATARAAGGGAAAPDDGTAPQRVVSDAGGTQTLPGRRVRGEGEPASGDAAADEAYDGLGATWQLYREQYGRDSLDDKGLPLLASVHYGTDYDNAFWDGTQMVFGDGDGRVFTRFTVAVDVIGHELTHGVTELTAGLTYQGQSGALNESISDVFGSLVRQRAAGETADQADWLIGKGLFTPSVKGVALRSMKAPGTAYDDPQLGKDPQPADMSGYVQTTDDNGGVHLNSGIPNRAFYLAATAIGGNTWEGAGQVWYDVLTGGTITADCDFATFAGLTVAAAEARYAAGSPQARAVRDAWVQVGVLSGASAADGASATSTASTSTASTSAGSTGAGSTGAGSTGAGPSGATPAGAAVRVRRTGGIAGQHRRRTVALAELSDDDAHAWRGLLADDGLRALAARRGRVIPDAFTYHVACPPESDEVELPELDLPEDVRDLLRRTLDA